MSDETNEGNNPAGLQGSTGGERAHQGDVARGSSAVPAPRRLGLSARGERILDVAGIAFLVLFALAWAWSIANAREAAGRGELVPTAGGTLAASLSHGDAPTTAYLTDAAIETFAGGLRGRSGRLRARTVLPGDTISSHGLPSGAAVVYESPGDVANGDARPAQPGIQRLAVGVGKALKPVADLNVITMLPFTAKQRGRIGLYYIGSWPSESGARGPKKAPAGRYGNPRGFIQVTRENQNTHVSQHFQLRDFLTKDQPHVWPKYLVLEMRLIDKLELVMADLARRGVNTEGVVVMSGFRTPQYNVGGGNTGGRAGLSRHMYGDAADVYIDNDGNGTMDDINRDGRVDVRDAWFMNESVERVERENPELVGGAGVYVACCGHGPFIHIDTRGYRARWTGSGGG